MAQIIKVLPDLNIPTLLKMVSIRLLETFLPSLEWLFFQCFLVLVFLLFEFALKNSFESFYFEYHMIAICHITCIVF